METIVHDPLNRITAKEANARAIKRKENSYKETLQRVYGAIHARVSLGHFDTEQIIDGHDEADYIFNQLVMEDEYAVELSAVNGNPDDHRFKLTISWDSDSIVDPNKKYILPMDDVYSLDCYGNSLTGYAYKGTNGSWFMAVIGTNVNGEDIERLGYTVTAKDLEYAPEWVKVLEPVEVEG